jgi:hypothetical protein
VIDRYAPNANNARCQPSTRRRWRQLRLRNERPVRCDSIDRINRLVCVAVALCDAIIRRRSVTCVGVRFRLGERRQDNRDPALPRFLTLALAGALDRRKRVRRPKSAPGSKADLKEPMIDVRSSPTTYSTTAFALALPPPHSITSSARVSSVGGIVRPSAFAVVTLMTNSYLVGVCTGRSAGFAPLRMRSIYVAACRYWATMSAP